MVNNIKFKIQYMKITVFGLISIKTAPAIRVQIRFQKMAVLWICAVSIQCSSD